MLSDRGLKIKGELVKSFLISGRTEMIPDNEILETQVKLMDADLNPNIEIRHLEALFKVSRVTSWHPALTELERAFKSDEFRKVFPRKAFVSDNLMKTLPISEKQADIYEANRAKLKNFNWRKK